MERLKITVIGKRDDPYYEKCKAALDWAMKKDHSIEVVNKLCFETDWNDCLKELRAKYGGSFKHHVISPLVYFNESEYIGGAEQLLEWAENNYGYTDATHIIYYKKRYKNALVKQISKNPQRIYCYMSIKIETETPSTVIFELFADIAPLTCQNFLNLCKGYTFQEANGQKTLIGYKGTYFHRIVPKAFAQGGMILGKGMDYSIYQCI